MKYCERCNASSFSIDIRCTKCGGYRFRDTPDLVDELIDTAFNVGVGMAIGSLFNRDDTPSAPDPTPSFDGGGGSFGGGGASGSWDD